MSHNGTAKTKCSNSSTVSNDTCNIENVSVTSSVISMTVGLISNTLALFILLRAYQRLRLKSKAFFLLFASALVVTDFLGHLINGSLTLYVYSLNKDWKSFDPKLVLCGVFGVCMSFFGLSPLLLGATMAVERCVGVTRPLFHTTFLTSYLINWLLALSWLLALLVALLPVILLHPYQVQGSQSWCFYRLVGPRDWLDMLLSMIFSVLGLLALLISCVCNIVTGLTLLWSRMHHEHDYHCSRRHSLHTEMICQLLSIMMGSCVCWGPLLVTIIVTSFQEKDEEANRHLLLTVRMATWNQILDPWVYILLRRAVLKHFCLLARRFHSPNSKHGPGVRWRFSSLRRSVKASSPVSSKPDFICLDGPFLPADTFNAASRNYA